MPAFIYFPSSPPPLCVPEKPGNSFWSFPRKSPGQASRINTSADLSSLREPGVTQCAPVSGKLHLKTESTLSHKMPGSGHLLPMRASATLLGRQFPITRSQVFLSHIPSDVSYSEVWVLGVVPSVTAPACGLCRRRQCHRVIATSSSSWSLIRRQSVRGAGDLMVLTEF